MLPLTNFQLQNYCENEPRFNGVYSRNNLQKIKYGAYIINLNEYKSIATHQIVLYVNGDNATYYDSFAVEHRHKQQNYNNKHFQNTSIQSNNVWIGFIDFMLKGKSLLEYSNLFSPNKYKKNDQTILKYFNRFSKG